MTNCKEFSLDDMMAITAIPVSDIPAGDVDSPVNKLTPTIPADEFYPNLENAIVIGRKAATDGGMLVPIKRTTGKAKASTQDSVAGRLHTITVSCEADERGGEIWEPVATMDGVPCNQRLERTAHHLLLSFRDGRTGFVAATEDTYLCTIEYDGSKTSVEFRIQNLMGIQMVI